MAKIEEISVMLVEELASFEKSIQQLNKSTEKIQKIKLTVDTQKINSEFKKFSNQIEEKYLNQENQLTQLRSNINTKIILSKWVVVLLIVFLVFSVSSFSYGYYQQMKSKEIQNTAYNQGVYDIKNHFQKFLSENPRTQKIYNKWLKKQ